ncbi:MAG TPA: HAD-IIIA family hydrolase, partial [Gemmatimonadales bacterium]|nr:HAD-IIIA family hydrolase [Gemmatimonadales bacterium]
AALGAVRARLEKLLEEAGVQLTGTYACLHGPDEGCPCRKPSDLLARQAAAEHGLDLGRAIVVGDKASDLALGHRLGVPTFLVTSGYGQATLAARAVVPDFVVDSLEAVARICTHPAGVPRTLSP